MQLTTGVGQLHVDVRRVPDHPRIFVATHPALIHAGDNTPFERRVVEEGTLLMPGKLPNGRTGVWLRYASVYEACRAQRHMLADGYPSEQGNITASREALMEILVGLLQYGGLPEDKRGEIRRYIVKLGMEYKDARNRHKVDAYVRFLKSVGVSDASDRSNPGATLVRLRRADRDLDLRLDETVKIVPNISRREMALLQLKRDQLRVVYMTRALVEELLRMPFWTQWSQAGLPERALSAEAKVREVVRVLRELYVLPFIQFRNRCCADLTQAQADLTAIFAARNFVTGAIGQGRVECARDRLTMTHCRLASAKARIEVVLRALKIKSAQVRLEERIAFLSLAMSHMTPTLAADFRAWMDTFEKKVYAELSDERFASPCLPTVKDFLGRACLCADADQFPKAKECLECASAEM